MYQIYKEYHTNSQHATSPCPPDLHMVIGKSSSSGDGDLLCLEDLIDWKIVPI